MCMIAIYQPDTTINLELLNGAAKANPDGFGFLIHTTNTPVNLQQLHIKPKSVGTNHIIAALLSFETAAEQFINLKQTNPDAVAVFHARKTTLGPSDITHTHPYRTKDGLYVFHNGIFPGYGSETISDTADWLQQHTNKPNWLTKFQTELGTGRAVIYDPKTNKIKTLGFEKGQTINGVLYSNTSYTGTPDPV